MRAAADEQGRQGWLAPAGAVATRIPAVVEVRIPAVPVRVPRRFAVPVHKCLRHVPRRCCPRPVALGLVPRVRPGCAPAGLGLLGLGYRSLRVIVGNEGL